MQTEQKIAQLLSELQFERRRPVTRVQRQEYAALQKEVDEVRRCLNALHLRLWHAQQRRDYHSLSLEEARGILANAAERLSTLSAQDE